MGTWTEAAMGVWEARETVEAALCSCRSPQCSILWCVLAATVMCSQERAYYAQWRSESQPICHSLLKTCLCAALACLGGCSGCFWLCVYLSYDGEPAFRRVFACLESEGNPSPRPALMQPALQMSVLGWHPALDLWNSGSCTCSGTDILTISLSKQTQQGRCLWERPSICPKQARSCDLSGVDNKVRPQSL